jgi:DNA-binding ferritin-like protein (Dps family)
MIEALHYWRMYSDRIDVLENDFHEGWIKIEEYSLGMDEVNAGAIWWDD